MEVAAAKATDDPKEGRARRKDRVAASQTEYDVKRIVDHICELKDGKYLSELGFEIWRQPCGRNAATLRLERTRTSYVNYLSWRTIHSARHLNRRDIGQHSLVCIGWIFM